jgi:hypothetical protein
VSQLFGKVARQIEAQRKAVALRLAAIYALAFAEQLAAIQCHARFVCLICSGRAGKTRAFLLKWLEVKERKPGQISVYIALSRQSAKRMAWVQLQQLNKELNLGLTFNIAELTIKDDRGSQLVILGANRDDLVDVLRGFPFVLLGCDEAAFFRTGLLERVLDDAMLIRMMDLDAEAWLMSTPGYVLSGYHYRVVSGQIPSWRQFAWTFFANPFLPIGRTDLTLEEKRAWRENYAAEIRETKGWTDKSPSYMREFLGLYADDPDRRVYKFERKVHCIPRMPDSWLTHRHEWTTVLGIDFGSTNATAWVLWAFRHGSPDVYAVKAYKVYGMAPSQTADISKDWIDTYGPSAVVGDSAAKGYIDEHAVRYQIGILPANKLGKQAHVLIMNDDFMGGRIRIVEPDCEAYCSELEKLGKDPRYERGHPKYGEEDPYAENDACDAGLYGYTHVYAWVEGLRAKRQAIDDAARRMQLGDPDPYDMHDYKDRGEDQSRYML